MNTTDRPLVAAVIAHFRTYELTLECARSVAASRGARVKVVIIDNASGDGSADRLRAALPDASVVTLPSNVGYPGALNAGTVAAREMGAEFVFFLNSDTLLDEDCIARLIAEAEQHADAALVSPAIFYEEPRDLLWFGGSRFSLWTGRAVHVGRKRPADAGLSTPCDIPFATGCAMLASRTALEKVGPFDESLFGYAEDLDWSLRAREAGFRLRYAPSATLRHREGVSHRLAGGDALRLYLTARNTLRVMARHASWYHWIVFLPTFVVDFVGRFSFLTLRAGDWRGFGAIYRGIWHAIVGGRHHIEPAEAYS